MYFRDPPTAVLAGLLFLLFLRLWLLFLLLEVEHDFGWHHTRTASGKESLQQTLWDSPDILSRQGDGDRVERVDSIEPLRRL